MPGIDYRRDVLNPLVAALRQLDALPVDVVDASSRSDAVRYVRTMLTHDLTSHYLDTPARSRVELMAAWLTAQNRTGDARELRQRVRGLLRDVDAWARREAVATCEGELRRAEWDNVVVDARELAHRLELRADVPVVAMLKAAAADVRAGLADVRELWARELPGEPWPTTTEDWAALAVRAGVSADTILSGQWTWADVEPIAMGYLRRLRDVVPQDEGGDEARDRVPPMRELVAVADLRAEWPMKGRHGVKGTSAHLAGWLDRHKCDVHTIGAKNYIRIDDALGFWSPRSNTHKAIRKMCHVDDDQQ